MRLDFTRLPLPPRAFLDVFYASAVSFALVSMALTAPACGYKPSARDASMVLSIIEIGCILAHEEVEDEAALKKICNVADEKGDDFLRLLSARREGKMQRAKLGLPATPICPPAPSTSASAKP